MWNSVSLTSSHNGLAGGCVLKFPNFTREEVEPFLLVLVGVGALSKLLLQLYHVADVPLLEDLHDDPQPLYFASLPEVGRSPHVLDGLSHPVQCADHEGVATCLHLVPLVYWGDTCEGQLYHQQEDEQHRQVVQCHVKVDLGHGGAEFEVHVSLGHEGGPVALSHHQEARVVPGVVGIHARDAHLCLVDEHFFGWKEWLIVEVPQNLRWVLCWASQLHWASCY